MHEIAVAVRSGRSAEHDLDEDELIALIAENTGARAHLIRTAIRYWSSYPAEIDAEISAAAAAEDAAESAWQRERHLFAG